MNDIIADYVRALMIVGDDVCDHSAVVKTLVNMGWEKEDAQIMTVSYPIICQLGEIREIWIFGDDDRLKRKMLARNHEFYNKMLIASKSVMEITCAIGDYLPKAKNCHDISANVWIGGIHGP